MNEDGERIECAGPRTRLVWAALLDQFGAKLPPYPGVGAVEAAALPAPPLLRPGDAVGRKVWALMQAYTLVITHEYGASFAFARLDERTMAQSKHFPALFAAVPVMEELAIAPIAWVAFSVYAWRAYVVEGGRGKTWDAAPSAHRGPRRAVAPSPVWTFSEKRLRDRVDWFTWQESHWRGGRLVFTKAHRELLARYNRLKLTIMRIALERAPTDADVDAAISQHLSKATYARLKDTAETEALVQEDEWKRAIRAGKWIW